jgi:hypothetical protein
VPERFPQRLVYNHDSQCPAYWHNQMATSVGQSSDWVPPSPSLASRRTPLAPRTAGHEPEESVSTCHSRTTRACGMDALHQELDADSQAAPRQLTLQRKSLPMMREQESVAKPAAQMDAYQALQHEAMGVSVVARTSCPTQAPEALDYFTGGPLPFTDPSKSSDNNSSDDEHCDGGGGSGGGGGGGGGGGDPGQTPHLRKKANLHHIRINTWINLKDFPKWDGTHSKVITWIFNVTCWANLRRAVDKHLGKYLVQTLKEGSPVLELYNNLLPDWKAYMHSRWTRFVKVICNVYLTQRWVNDCKEEFHAQRFHQPGYETELPSSFLNQCMCWIRVLSLARSGSATKILMILRSSPFMADCAEHALSCGDDPVVKLQLRSAHHACADGLEELRLYAHGFGRAVISRSPACSHHSLRFLTVCSPIHSSRFRADTLPRQRGRVSQTLGQA